MIMNDLLDLPPRRKDGGTKCRLQIFDNDTKTTNSTVEPSRLHTVWYGTI